MVYRFPNQRVATKGGFHCFVCRVVSVMIRYELGVRLRFYNLSSVPPGNLLGFQLGMENRILLDLWEDYRPRVDVHLGYGLDASGSFAGDYIDSFRITLARNSAPSLKANPININTANRKHNIRPNYPLPSRQQNSKPTPHISTTTPPPTSTTISPNPSTESPFPFAL